MCAGARRWPCRKRAGLVCKIIVWSQVPNKIPLVAVEGEFMTQKAKEAKPPEIVWVALYSVLVLMLMMLCVDVAAR